MAAASFILSVIAILVSGMTLGWGMYEWRRSGPRLKVKGTAFHTFGPLGTASYIAVDVTNTGRLSTVVQTVGFRLPSGSVLITAEPSLPTVKMPCSLEPGASFTYPMDIPHLHEQLAEKGLAVSDLTPFANSGHGMTTGKFDESGLTVLRENA